LLVGSELFAMGTIKLILGFAVVAGVIMGASQVIPPELANYSFQDDLREVAMAAGANPNKTDEDLRNVVLRKAKEHNIELEPRQVTVQRITSPGMSAAYLAVDYSVPVNLPGYSFDLHFTPSSGNKGF
jgi:hypothetical protein